MRRTVVTYAEAGRVPFIRRGRDEGGREHVRHNTSTPCNTEPGRCFRLSDDCPPHQDCFSHIQLEILFSPQKWGKDITTELLVFVLFYCKSNFLNGQISHTQNQNIVLLYYNSSPINP